MYPDYLTAGLVPFVVPPTSGKSSFFDNLTIRDQWRQAQEQLALAGRLVVIGYSLPATDTLSHTLLGTSVPGACEIDVVNPDRTVAAAISDILPGRSVRNFNSLEHFVAERKLEETTAEYQIPSSAE
jgi:hypothetical protein